MSTAASPGADRFGNPLDPIVRYARGTILAGTDEEVARMLKARQLVAERVLVAGINQGANMGDDTLYSGTVAAAMEGFLFGIPAIAVLLFEVVLNATSMFNHANVSMPAALDRVLRLLVVTPDMHRVHHSILRNETDSNFGFNLPWWDRLFGTYRAAPAAGHHGMTIGLPIFRNPRELRVDRLLTQPFRDDTVAADDESGPGAH